MDESYYLKEGEQTRLTDLVREHVILLQDVVVHHLRFESLPPELARPIKAVYKTSHYIDSLHTIEGYIENPLTPDDHNNNVAIKMRVFRKRTVDQILREGIFPTCSDHGVLFRGLMIAQGIPTGYIETFSAKTIAIGRPYTGHVYARIYAGNSAFIINPDPLDTQVLTSEPDMLPYVIYREGLDSWDIGIRSYDDIWVARDTHLDQMREKYEKMKNRAGVRA